LRIKLRNYCEICYKSLPKYIIPSCIAKSVAYIKFFQIVPMHAINIIDTGAVKRRYKVKSLIRNYIK